MKKDKFTSIYFLACILILIFTTTSLTKPGQRADPGKEVYLFSYFTDEGKGMHYAISNDGLTWKEVKKNTPWLIPRVGGKLMRDPSVNMGIDGIYRVVWTTGWTGTEIGYASSADLIHWTKERAIPVMKNVEGTKMCWAPEIFYDDVKEQYMILWSSAVKNTWSVYYTTTTDFKIFSDPAVLLNNGYYGGGKAGQKGPIDAFIFKEAASKYILFYKEDDNTGVPNLFYRFASSPQGQWIGQRGPIMPSTGDEGPSCVKVKGEYRLYTDPFESDHAYVFISKDLKTWERKKTDLKMSHGTVLKIPGAAAQKLLAY